MANEKSIRRNYLYNVSYQIFILITPFITTPYLARVLGADGIGTYSFNNSISAYFATTAILGTSIYGLREVSYVSDRKDKYSLVFWNTELLCIISTLICLGLYLLYVLFFSQNKLIALALVPSILVSALDITWLFQGLEDFKRIAIRNFMVRITAIVFIFLFVKQKSDLVLYIFGTGCITALGAFSMWGYLPRLLDRVDLKSLRPFSVLKTSLVLFLPTIALKIYSALDKTMIGFLAPGGFESGYYEYASQISLLTMTLITAMGGVMIPKIGFLFGKGNKERIQEYMTLSYRFVWFTGVPICFGLISVAQIFVPWFYGPGYEKVIELLYILSFLVLVMSLSTVTGTQYMVPTKRQKEYNISIFLGLGINICLNAVLIPHLYAMGAALASIIAEASILAIQFYYVREEISWKKVMALSFPYMLAGILMCIPVFLLGRVLTPGFFSLLLQIALGAGIYVVVLLLEKDDVLITMFELAVRFFRGLLSKFTNRGNSQ